MTDALEDVWRRETPHVLAALTRRYGDPAGCEDAVQEALLDAAVQWPASGAPASPRGWLITVAARRLIDRRRADTARERREIIDTTTDPAFPRVTAGADDSHSDADDSLAMFLLCCDPALSRSSQVALTLRAVGGLTTRQIAAAFMVPETTVAQRISRAKATLRASGTTLSRPSPTDLADRVAAVVEVLTSMFNEGYATSGGGRLIDVSLMTEAIRLARMLSASLPAHDEVAAALALMVLTSARTAARVDGSGALIPLARQDRRRWDRAAIAEGMAILERVLPRGPVGRYQLQAAIAAVHSEARCWTATDWPQIRELYRMLEQVAPGPTVTLNRAVAEAAAGAPGDGLVVLDGLTDDPAMRTNHRFHAVRGHFREQLGDLDGAAADYRTAARLTTSIPEQRYLNSQLAGLSSGSAVSS